MKTRAKTPFVLHLLIAGLGLIPVGQVKAQLYTILHTFTPGILNTGGQLTNSDGYYPIAGLILAGNTLYGTASGGGTLDRGTVFSINTDGTGFTNLHSFSGGSDGAGPFGGLVLSGNSLYGTASGGGISNRGTVFAVSTDGNGFTNLYTFTAGSLNDGGQITNSDGAHPLAGLILAGDALYGTTTAGGTNGSGTVFKVNTDGTGFSNLYTFTTLVANTNSDGAAPYGDLALSGNTLYGAANGGGNSGYGTVFAVSTNGTDFTNLHSFTAGSGTYPNITNSDGAYPIGSLIHSGSILYGTASQGGGFGNGSLFSVNIDGTGFTNLHSFTGGSDGANPKAGLIVSGSTLYGMTFAGGSFNNGIVFAVNTNGTGFTNLQTFGAYGGGAFPRGSLVLSNHTLYGTTINGGVGFGDVFSISLAPLLTIIPSGPYTILSWPTNFTGFNLQKTVDLGPPAGWTSYNLIQPAIISNGQYVVTIPNTTTNTEQYYRLSQ